MIRSLARAALVSLSLPVLAGSAAAQTHLLTPPTGTEREGPDATLIFGWAANQGHRFMDATHADGKPRKIRGVSFRLDGRDHKAIGRTWSRVQVWVAHGDFASLQYNKSSAFRLVDRKVLVFDQAWSFPALKGRPPLSPAAWGGPRNSLSFRFKNAWDYNGKDAIFLEFRFSGGKADNNVPWVGPTPKGFEYFLDSMPEAAWRGKGGNEYFPPKKTSKPCFDSAFAANPKLAASLDAKIEVGNTVTLHAFSFYTAPKDLVVYLLGVGGKRKGLLAGAGCNALYVDLARPAVALLVPTDAKGYARATLKAPRAAWMKEFWLQGAWFDSRTRTPKLTRAVRVPVASGKPVPVMTSYVASSDGKFSVWTAAAKGLPYLRYDL